MSKAYSGDLRVRVIEMVRAGASRREAAEVIFLAASTTIKWLQKAGVCSVAFCDSASDTLHDLRHSFAVNTILDAYSGNDDPGARLAIPSIYLGHINPVHTYWYLSASPELLKLAGAPSRR
jgi:integrase